MNSLNLTLGHYDQRILLAFIQRRRNGADVVMRAITKLGNASIVIPITLAVAIWGSPKVKPAGIIAVWSLTLSHIVVQILKRSVSRRRPDLPAGLERLIVPEDRFSFPSGHATAALSVALPLFPVLAWPLAMPVLLMGFTVGISRCYLGVHYPGDVLVGWALAGSTVFGVSGFTG